MEGKEVRFGIVSSSLFAVVTTAASCGAVNAMHDSFTALGGMIPLINMQLGELIIGGVGAGLYGMLLFVVLAIFVAGLMVVRTRGCWQEDRGARGQDGDARHPGAALDVSRLDSGCRGAASSSVASMANSLRPSRLHSRCFTPSPRPPATTGSAFAGLSANTMFYKSYARVLDARVGRFFMIVPAMALCGFARGQEVHPALGWHAADHGRPGLVGLRGRRDPDCRRPHLLPGARAWPDSRTPSR